MASLEQHMKDCVQFLGQPFREVNIWLDEFYPILGASHRRVRHHIEGALEARSLFGPEADKAAAIHILRDCRNLPHDYEYESDSLDLLGMHKTWPDAAYIRYSEDQFVNLVKNKIFGAQGTLLWAFMNGIDLPGFMAATTRMQSQAILELQPKWSQAIAAKEHLSPLLSGIRPAALESESDKSYVDSLKESPLWQQIASQFGPPVVGNLPASSLIQPLLYLDGEYIEDLRAEFASLGETSLIRYTLPLSTNAEARATVDSTGKSVTIISSQKTLAIGPAQIRQVAGGIEVSFSIMNSLQMALVSHYKGRYYLRSGIHRAFLLAEAGYDNIPCMIVESADFPVPVSTVYPTFTADVLTQDRPPMLTDFLNGSLVINIPLPRLRRLLQVRADDSVVAVE
jgi:hypothetical protein